MDSSIERLSPELRQQYISTLSERDLLWELGTSAVAWCIWVSLLTYFLPDGPLYRFLASFISLIGAYFMFKDIRRKSIHDRLAELNKMPDDQLIFNFKNFEKSRHQSNLLVALILGAIAVGLVFTEQGNEILNKVFH